MTGSFSQKAQANSWMFMRKLPSPSMSMTVLAGWAAWAPMAAGRPKPMAPSPPLVNQFLGVLKCQYWAAHIWCWPTPVVTTVSSSRPRSRTICQSRSMAYWGRMASSRSGHPLSVTPPSTGSRTPVTYRASSDAR